MSDLAGQAFSALGGNYSLESRLRSIRGKLSEINSAVRNLESNMIFLLVNPELVNSTPSEASSSSQEQEIANLWGYEPNSVVMSVPKTDYGQEQFTTDPIELDNQLAQHMGVRHSLMVCESEILAAIYERNKKAYSEDAKSAHDYSINS